MPGTGQHYIIPADAVFEPDCAPARPCPPGSPASTAVGTAGLWDRYRNGAGKLVDSYTMLTINADQHPLFRHYHRPGDEKRMVVILPGGAFDAWLTAKPEESGDFMVPYPADKLVEEPVPRGKAPD